MERVLDAWRAPDGKGYRVAIQDGQVFELRYSEIDDTWSIEDAPGIAEDTASIINQKLRRKDE